MAVFGILCASANRTMDRIQPVIPFPNPEPLYCLRFRQRDMRLRTTRLSHGALPNCELFSANCQRRLHCSQYTLSCAKQFEYLVTAEHPDRKMVRRVGRCMSRRTEEVGMDQQIDVWKEGESTDGEWDRQTSQSCDWLVGATNKWTGRQTQLLVSARLRLSRRVAASVI